MINFQYNMTYHILNGDALAETFKKADITGELIITREALIDGNLDGDSLSEFWQNRAESLGTTLGEYQAYVVSEFEKIMLAPNHSVFNLWFGYDLFCQTNMWFVLWLIDSLVISKDVYVVYPVFLDEADKWKEYGLANAQDLQTSLHGRVRFHEQDFVLARQLWQAYKTHNLEALQALALTKSACFPYLAEACRAHIERFSDGGKPSRPESVLTDIMKQGETDFYKVFSEFNRREGVYGFGDMQVKVIYDKLVKQ